MNEQKVKELILAAGAEYHFSGDIVVNHVETFAKKLIELTVRDCADIVYGYRNEPGLNIMDKMFKHFEIEEFEE